MRNIKFYILIFILFLCFLFSGITVNAAPLDDVTFHVPDVNKIYNYDNFFYSNSEENKISSDEYEAFFSVTSKYTSGFLNSDTNKYSYSDYIFTMNSNIKFMKWSNFHDDYIKRFSFYYFNDYFHLKKNTKYQLLYKLSKSKSLTYGSIKSEDIVTEINVLNNKNYYLETLTKENLEILSTDFIVEPDSKDTSKNSNQAYLLITFQINDTDLVENDFDYSLDSITVYSDNFDIGVDKYFLKQTMPDKELIFKFSYFAFIENGSIQVNSSIGSSDGGHGTGGGRHENLDTIHEDDLIIFEDTEICESGDIFCGIKNIFTQLKNLVTRIGNGFNYIANVITSAFSNFLEKLLQGLGTFFKYLFVPSDYFMDNFLNAYKVLFVNQLGFLSYPFEVLGNLLNSYLNLSTNPVISIPDIKEPFNNHVLISARTFNFQDTFNTGSFKTIYDIYMAFVSVIIIFGFLNYSIKKYNEFVKNRGGGS